MIEGRRDRTARLLKLVILLYQAPSGVPPAELARLTGVSIRTVYRDLRALEEIGFPVWEHGGRYGTAAFLPPLKLTLHEAVALFLSARLLARHAGRRDEHVLGAFEKLAAILPPSIAPHVRATIAELTERPRRTDEQRVMERLSVAWAEGRRVRIEYPYLHPSGRVYWNQRLVAPYFLEPNPFGPASYLIALDDYSGAIRTFKIERIRSAELTDERFEPPSDFDAAERFRLAWVVADEAPVEVRLLFHDGPTATRARESRWHPSQQAIDRPDGRLELRFTVGGLLEITPWVLSWGETVEVLDPPELRERVRAVAEAQLARYAAPIAAR